MNKVILIGNLGGDPELRHTQNDNTPVCKFSLATTERRQQGEQTTWHNVVVWGKGGEICAKHLTKGQKVAIDGKIVHRKYQDKQGVDRTVTEIHVNSPVEFLSPRREQGGRSDQGSAQEGGDNNAW